MSQPFSPREPRNPIPSSAPAAGATRELPTNEERELARTLAAISLAAAESKHGVQRPARARRLLAGVLAGERQLWIGGERALEQTILGKVSRLPSVERAKLIEALLHPQLGDIDRVELVMEEGATAMRSQMNVGMAQGLLLAAKIRATERRPLRQTLAFALSGADAESPRGISPQGDPINFLGATLKQDQRVSLLGELLAASARLDTCEAVDRSLAKAIRGAMAP